jgi:hypothetical protein
MSSSQVECKHIEAAALHMRPHVTAHLDEQKRSRLSILSATSTLVSARRRLQDGVCYDEFRKTCPYRILHPHWHEGWDRVG